jgi:esterase
MAPMSRRFAGSLCAALILAGCQSIPAPTWELPTGVKTLAVNGYPMAYVERGTGPTVVLVHGARTDYRFWEPQVASLSSRYRVVAVSLRHYYPERWDGKGDEFSPQVHAADVAAFIERLGAGPVYLVGHSRGGSVAAGAARMRPDLVKKLVLLEPVLARLAGPAGAGAAGAREARAKAVAELFGRGDIEGGLAHFIDDTNGPGTWKRIPEEERRLARDNAWTLVANTTEVDTLACDDLRGVTMPVLLVESEKVTRPRKAVLDAAAKCFPAATRATIPDAGHYMSRENPAAFERELVRFFGT